ncbi:AEC family transporter [uncultured Arcobacter sp.]|uniref:AEC family transporter n=1 Tax=uncultured Arcobacter sp. TaxID=165434 RepID=UPI002607D5C5|nr:AEC family transporter [uncultured Arcobacter sp.]
MSVATIYLFIIIGFVFKRTFRDDVNERTIVLLNLYFLQPILIFWGLTRAPLSFELLISPIIYFIAIFIVLGIAYLYSLRAFKNEIQDKSIFMASSLVGNTGNLGIPLGIALFGLESVPFTSALNIANIFYIYIFSVYFFAGEKFNFTNSLKEIFKIPAIWFTFFALLFNYFDFHMSADFEKVFTMGAYTAIVMQLVIFGIFMSQVKIRSANWNLALNISLFKHFVLPVVGLFVILFFDLPAFVGAIIFMELFVPLAVNNVNIASLYKCKPIDTTFSVLISSFIFIFLMYVYIVSIEMFFGL